MTVIKARCPVCGDVELGPKDVHLLTFNRGGRDFYEFICPLCGDLVRKAADEHIVSALRLGRIPETHTALPDEALDEKRDLTVTLTYDDLLDFCLELGETDDLASAQ